MAFLRFTRDRRGYENMFLLHAFHPGDRPRVLYWYRSAPGVRVGRPALDEDAIRTIEEQHPDVEFDWPHILEVGAIMQPEIEERPLRPRRRIDKELPPEKVQRVEAVEAGEGVDATAGAEGERIEAAARDRIDGGEDFEGPEATAVSRDRFETAPPSDDAPRPHDLLEELVGREIATRLRARYAEIAARLHQLPDNHPQRGTWQARADTLNPDNWVTPHEVLKALQHADAHFDSLRRDLLAHS
ncbi:MAG TPA: hypothetical protein VEK56_04740 [Vicinamibacterales bacterium]|nr:hypothetical protein [Vicinamibacterales bacterium]